MIAIDYLTESDLPEFNQLYKECFGEFSEDLSSMEINFNKLVKLPEYHLLAARKDNLLVGYTMVVVIREFAGNGDPFMTVWSVCVKPSYRRQGVATDLFTRVEQIAKDSHCEFITFISGKSRTGAHSFYESLGYDMQRDKAGIKFLLY